MKRFGMVWLLASLLNLSIWVTTISAQNGPYTIAWWTIDGGGGASNSGQFTLVGTVGQPDAGTLSNGNYVLTGGFWTHQGTGAGNQIFLPNISR